MHPSRTQFLYAALILSSTACEGILGLSEFRAQEEHAQTSAGDAGANGCRNHAQCPLTGDPDNATFCSRLGKCGALRSDGCNFVTGPEGDNDAIVIGSLFGTSGAEAANNRARQNAVVLAVEEINAAGGVPAPDHGQHAPARALLLVSCDGTSDPARAAGHLVDLGALAIVGPDTSQDMIDISMKRTIGSGVMLISPSAMTDSINDLLDADLDWLLAPTVEQRAPLLLRALSDIETALAVQRTQPLKLGVVFRDDALGRSTLASLQTHRFADQTLAQAGTNSDRVRIDRYDPENGDRAALVDTYRKFGPDIIVLIGMTEAITDFLIPLERSWDADDASRDRPHYLLSEASKVPALLALAQQRPDVRVRVRGVGVTPSSEARPIYESFQNRYDARYGDGLSSASGVGAAYDGMYAIAYALSSVERGRESGIRVAQALRWLSLSDSFVSVGPVGMSTAFQKLSVGERVSVLGTMNALQWDDNGSTRAGAVEVWCIGASDDAVRFSGSGLMLDVGSRALSGSWNPCTSPGVMTHETSTSPSANPEQTPSQENETKTPSEPAHAGAPAMPEPSAGTAGARMGGPQAGVGGAMQPPPPAAGQAAPPRHTTNILCGSRSCSLQNNEHCCVEVVRPYTGPEPQDVMCRSNTSTGSMCELTLHCASDTECAPGSVCCATEHSSVCMDSAQCNALSARRLGCESSQDCAPNSACCIRISSDATTFVSTTCDEQCNPLQGGGRLCLNDAECAAVNPQLVCKPSYVLPNVKVCWPAN